MAQSGYPWTVDLHVIYDLSAEGLTVTQTATNLSDRPAPYASGAHPYLSAGSGSGRRLGADTPCLPPAAGRRATDPGGRGGGHRHGVRLPRGAAAARPPTRRWVRGPGARRGRRRHRRGARPCDRPRRGSLGRPASSLADGLQRRRRVGPAAAGARGRADDGSTRRVPQRPRPADAGACRRCLATRCQSPGGSGRSSDSAAVRARSIRSWRTAILARSPSADWIASACWLVPSARSRIAKGAPRRQVHRQHLCPLEHMGAVAVDDLEAGRAGGDLASHQPPGDGAGEGGDQEHRDLLVDRDPRAHLGTDGVPPGDADHDEQAAEEAERQPHTERAPGVGQGRLRDGRHGCRSPGCPGRRSSTARPSRGGHRPGAPSPGPRPNPRDGAVTPWGSRCPA